MIGSLAFATSRHRRLRRELLALCLLVPSASCVPDGISARPAALAGVTITVDSAIALEPPPAPESLPAVGLAPAQAVEANLAVPVAKGAHPAAAPFQVAGETFSDQLRALDCLSAAVYYEARSESEDGQRAVAQVVLNRVRHPAYPNSVCAVVYQGPQRAGGGCQFAFTCDGSLGRRPVEPAWGRARRIAAQALAGRVYAEVGTATHYHGFSVFPHWAANLVKSAVIGAHIFYRWRGAAGRPVAFSQAYAGREPARTITPTAPVMAASLPTAPRLAYVPVEEAVWLPRAPARASDIAEADLPESTIRAEFRNSGRIREEFN